MAADEKKPGTDANAPKAGSPVDLANKAAIKDAAERIDAQEKAAAAYTVSDSPIVAGAQAFADAAKKAAESPKFNENGDLIGVDGKSAVSNENPDPAAVRY